MIWITSSRRGSRQSISSTVSRGTAVGIKATHHWDHSHLNSHGVPLIPLFFLPRTTYISPRGPHPITAAIVMSPSTVAKLAPESTIFFVCDIQSRFRPAIYGFEEVVLTASRMLRVAKVLEIPVLATEQNPKALGSTVPELDLASLGPLFLGAPPKSLFSMVIPEVKKHLQDRNIKSVVIFGIETHVCVLQSTLDLLADGYDVHVLADGVSSCNKEEIPIALERLRQAGAQITTSESAAFQLIADSSKPNFKAFSGIIKDEKDKTKRSLQTLAPVKSKL